MNSAEPSKATPLGERYRALLELGSAFLGTTSSDGLYQAIYDTIKGGASS